MRCLRSLNRFDFFWSNLTREVAAPRRHVQSHLGDEERASDGIQEWIPDSIEAEVGEVFHITGGEFRHARRTECQGQPRIDDPPTGERRRCGVPPHLVHDGHALGQSPPGIRAVSLADMRGIL